MSEEPKMPEMVEEFVEPEEPVAKKKNKTLWIILIVVAVLLILCCCASVVAVIWGLVAEDGWLIQLLEDWGMVFIAPFIA